MERLSRIPAMSVTLQDLSPPNSPVMWFVVNFLCCVWSLLLFLLILFGTDDSEEKAVIKQHYLFYNFMTTFIWVVEMGLTVWVSHRGRHSTSTSFFHVSWEVALEFLVSVYFLIDATVMVIAWDYTKHTLIRMSVDAVVGILAYFYVSSTAFQSLLKRHDFEEIPDVTPLKNIPPTRPLPTSLPLTDHDK